MAAPTRNSFNTATTGTTNSDTLTISPGGAGALVNDVIDVFVASDGVQTQTVSSGAGWSKITQINDGTANVCLALFRLVVTVDATVADLVVDMGATTEMAVAHWFRIRPSSGLSIVALTPTTAQGNSSNPDPASITNGSGASRDIYYLAVWGGDGNNIVSTVAPTNYGNHQSTGIANNAGSNIGSADRTRNGVADGGAEDPGTFTRAVEQWTAITVGYYEVPATQTLTPSLFTNSQTFHSPTVTPGAVNLSPSLFSNSQSFHTPTVAATYALTADLFTNAQTFHAPTVSASYTLAPSLFANDNTFYGATVTTSYTLSPDLFSNNQTFHAPAVQPGPVFLSPSPFTNSQAFYAPALLATYGLAPSLFTNEQMFYAIMVWADTAPGSGSWSGIDPESGSWTPVSSTSVSWS